MLRDGSSVVSRRKFLATRAVAPLASLQTVTPRSSRRCRCSPRSAPLPRAPAEPPDGRGRPTLLRGPAKARLCCTSPRPWGLLAVVWSGDSVGQSTRRPGQDPAPQAGAAASLRLPVPAGPCGRPSGGEPSSGLAGGGTRSVSKRELKRGRVPPRRSPGCCPSPRSRQPWPATPPRGHRHLRP